MFHIQSGTVRPHLRLTCLISQRLPKLLSSLEHGMDNCKPAGSSMATNFYVQKPARVMSDTSLNQSTAGPPAVPMAPLNEEISRGTFDLEMLPFLCFRSVGLVRGEALRDGYMTMRQWRRGWRLRR